MQERTFSQWDSPPDTPGSLGQYGVHSEGTCANGDMVFITKVEVGSNHLLFSFHLGNTVRPTYCFTHMVIYFKR